MTISRVENACKPLILQGLQKNSKIISTQGLTVLIISVILQLEQRKRDKKKGSRVPTTTLRFSQSAKINYMMCLLKGDMTYVST